MKKLTNIVLLLLACVAAWAGTTFVFQHLQPDTIISAVKFIAAPFTPIGALALQMMWKVHDATKKVPDRWSRNQVQRLQQTANLVTWRLWLLVGASILGSVLGATTAAFEAGSATAPLIARTALSLLGVCALYAVIYLPRLHFDIVALERMLTNQQQVADRKKAMLDKLTKQ